MLEQIALADYQAGDTAIFKGTLGADEVTRIAFADYDGGDPTQYDDDDVWAGVTDVVTIAVKEADVAGEGNLESEQYRYTGNFAVTTVFADPSDNTYDAIYDTHAPGDIGVYDWGGGRYNGNNNGYIPYGCREAASDNSISLNTAARNFHALEASGLIKCITASNFNCRKKMAREWALTFQVMNGAAPSGEWKHFKTKASTKNDSYSTKRDTNVFKLENLKIV